MNGNSIRERIIREVIRRIETKTFDNVAFDRITRGEIPDDYTGAQGSLLAVLEGTEAFGQTANRVMQSELELFFMFAVPLAAGEVAATVSNNVAGELVKALVVQHTLEEGGAGMPLSATFAPVSIQPNALSDADECAMATVEFKLLFRTDSRDPFAVRA